VVMAANRARCLRSLISAYLFIRVNSMGDSPVAAGLARRGRLMDGQDRREEPQRARRGELDI
jgi:hypothetical protein